MNVLFTYISNIRPERFFLFTALIFGSYFIYKVPPFQVPDEPNHFYRAWHIAEGYFSAEKNDQRVGGHLPAYVPEFVNAASVFKVTGQEPRSATLIFVDFNNTALYTPWCYAPSALAISIGKMFGLSMLHIFYFARFAGLFFWLLTIYFCIWLSPVFKWTLTLLALLPMSLFINGSISADVVTNASCFFFIALVLKLTYSHGNLDAIKYLLLVLGTALVISVKMVYAPLVLLLLFIPSGRYKNMKQYWLGLAGLLLVSCCTVMYMSKLTSANYLSYEKYNPQYRDKVALAWNADMSEQTKRAMANPEELVQVMLRSFVEVFDMYYPGYIGTFGWLDVHLPGWLIHLMYVAILMATATEVVYLGFYRRLQAAVIFLLIFLLVFLSQHLIWNPVGGDRIMNIQGRYFIPAVPVLLMSVASILRMKPALRIFLIVSCTLLALSISVYVLEHKYN